MQFAQRMTTMCDLHHANFMFGILERMFDLVNTQFFDSERVRVSANFCGCQTSASREIFKKRGNNKKTLGVTESLIYFFSNLLINSFNSFLVYAFFIAFAAWSISLGIDIRLARKPEATSAAFTVNSPDKTLSRSCAIFCRILLACGVFVVQLDEMLLYAVGRV